MRVSFVKCHGSGNDFPLIDARGLRLSDAEWAALARALADRAGPVGSDGLLALVEGDERAAFGMRMFNSDGSEAETCLNGLRCIARAGFAATGVEAATVRLKTSYAEVERAPDLAQGVFTVAETAGPASLDTASWPIEGAPSRLIDTPFTPLQSDRAFTAIAVPNPHLIAFVEKVDEAELVRIGQVCEAAPEWLPNRANVSFVEVRDAATLFVRTFERGVGLTNSCGSAMAAATIAACLTGRVRFDSDVRVLNRGGMVQARADVEGVATLNGNATWEWEGTCEVDIAAGRAGDLSVTRRFDDEVAAWAKVADAAV